MLQKRRLISIPIIHTHADFGSLGSKIPFDQEVEEMKSRYWHGVFDHVRNLAVDFSELRVYQDGLPDTSVGIVARIVDETQTPNYNVLRWLRDQGAHIKGTESPRLLLEEYQSLQAIFNAPSEELKRAARLEYMKKSALLLEGRDAYIAKKIKKSLPEGAVGLLFLGLGVIELKDYWKGRSRLLSQRHSSVHHQRLCEKKYLEKRQNHERTSLSPEINSSADYT